MSNEPVIYLEITQGPNQFRVDDISRKIPSGLEMETALMEKC
ncbi:unnamed protein product, partial [marine sediment metagenome]